MLPSLTITYMKRRTFGKNSTLTAFSIATLGSIHNLLFYLDSMEGMRKAIEFGSFEEFRQNFHRTFSRQLTR